MKELGVLTDIKGLEPTIHGLRNVMGYLITSIGAVPYQQMLQSVQQFNNIDITALGSPTFPYPQLFILDNVMVVCTQTAIFEFNGTTLTSKITGLSPGVLWDVADFQTYILFTNGRVAVSKKGGVYAIDSTVPYGTCICNYNGQLLLGSPNTPATGNI